MAINDPVRKSTYNKYAFIFLGFAVLCFFTSMYLNGTVGEKINKTLPANGGIVGPVKVAENNAVYRIRVVQSLRNYGDSSFIEGEVLDRNKEYLFGFGDELWKETGYDSDGRWSEEKNDIDMKVTFKDKGLYYLNFKTEMSNPRAGHTMSIQILPKRASSLAHFVLGLLALVVSVITWFKANVSLENLD